MSEMFMGCSSLTSLEISKFKTENVNDLSSMFNGCSSLSYLNLSSFNTEKCTKFTNIFEGCEKLTIKYDKSKCTKLADFIPSYVKVES